MIRGQLPKSLFTNLSARADWQHHSNIQLFVNALEPSIGVSPAMSVELFRCRGAARDGGTLECIFETKKRPRRCHRVVFLVRVPLYCENSAEFLKWAGAIDW